MQISLDKNDLEAIAAKVAERLQPLLKDKGKVEDAILDVDEVCQLLKISRQSLYQMVDNAKYGKTNFPYLKCGRLLRFSKIDILTWLKSK